MTAEPRRARVRALAKINLGLKVLHRRPDGYHELRTVFQTVSLADTLEIEFRPGRASGIAVASSVEIPDNIVERAARLVLEATRARGRVEVRLTKRIPMGAGLGGGSSDAAAVLLALPVLAGRRLPGAELLALAADLGSDVPFFLLGGRAVALGRGTELYPLPDLPPAFALIVAPDVHVATAEAYRALARPAASGLTSACVQTIISSFQSFAWSVETPAPGSGENDFESVVFSKYPQLKALKRQLHDSGARPALLSGSGSALFGLFASRRDAEAARRRLRAARVFSVPLVSRARYRALWWRQLAAHIAKKAWPPQSLYA